MTHRKTRSSKPEKVWAMLVTIQAVVVHLQTAKALTDPASEPGGESEGE